MENCEILAPVGNKAMLEAAVRSGADAVYFGVKNYNARRTAENFGVEDLPYVTEYCHKRNVKAYLTLNTVLSDSEMAGALDVAYKAYNSNIDAVIVADLGLIDILHTNLPGLNLHASTQISFTDTGALPILSALNISRVVLPREMSKQKIAEFVKAANKYNIQTEVFVHGALCMCVSGQCYLSAMLGSRSGNRGLCAGPCRLAFKAKGGTGYDLSLKDLCLLNYVEELKDMGVHSFKIEGRLKRPEYVAAVTDAYKNAVQNTGDEADAEKLKKVFSRSGFTSGYYNNKLSADMFGVRTKEDVTATAEILNQIHGIYRAERQSITVNGSFVCKRNMPISLTLAALGKSVTVTGPEPQESAGVPLSADSARASLSKFGGTPLLAGKIECLTEDNLSLKKSELNDLRRRAAEQLLERLAENTREIKIPPEIKTEKVCRKKDPEFYLRFQSLEQIPENLPANAKIILPLECVNGCNNKNIIADVPRAYKNAAEIENMLVAAHRQGVKTAVCGTLTAAGLSKSAGFDVIAGFGLNLYNSYAVNAALKLGFSAAVLSPEIKLSAAENIGGCMPIGFFAYGRLPLMVTANCPVSNGMSCKECKSRQSIEDRMNINFPVRCHTGYSEILNSKPTYLADKLPRGAFDFWYFHFTTESKTEVREIINAYVNALPPYTDYTRGLAFRGVE